MTYQDQVAAWMSECFPPEAGTDVFERSHRFLEESLELVQASGCTKDDAVAIINYVYDRPAGSLEQEVGGVMVTLAALCGALRISMDDASNNELARNWQRIEVIRHKQATKPVGSPLPQHVEKSLHMAVELEQRLAAIELSMRFASWMDPMFTEAADLIRALLNDRRAMTARISVLEADLAALQKGGSHE